MRRWWLMLALVLSFFDADAYNITNHRKITLRAIQLLREKFGADFISEHEAMLWVKGNVKEDAPTLNRLWNQHFYNPEKPDRLRPVEHSLNRRFRNRVSQYLDSQGDEKILRGGAIIHFIQDVTCPPHVVPVFHWGRKPDRFDILVVDSLLPLQLGDLKIFPFLPDFAARLLESTSRQTLDNLKQRFRVDKTRDGITVSDSIDWSYFWKGNPDGWFGDYGLLGKPVKQNRNTTDRYQQEEIKAGEYTWIISKSIYDSFSRQQVELAVTRTAAFIVYCKTKVSDNR